MGLLVDGVWRDQWYDTSATDGRFVRPRTRFRSWVTPDGSPGPSGTGGFAAEPARYHLYVSLACPWAHRTLIMRALKGLDDLISLSVVHWRMSDRGWRFDDGPGVIADPVLGARCLYEVYLAADRSYTGRVTTPLVWDRRSATIVNNESSEIIRMFNSAFSGLAPITPDYFPQPLRAAIEAMNEKVLRGVNDAVNGCGRSASQAAYDEAFDMLFRTLDELEAILGRQRFLCGDQQTEADWRLFPNLIRFDPISYIGYKCNLRRIEDYPNLSNYLRDLYQTPGIAQVCDVEGMKRAVFGIGGPIPSNGVVPKGPEMRLDRPHNRGRFRKAA
ncbi:MAG: glutathione-dependent reductase [Betaproteobacteria bacterium RIFCSPLOWO2_12_FULL_63_13]|nr:MAG: glutathione-dependent reductase [Betaproteobacteria bacterium RIFCSPLOWO2_12_FULL_63_13]